MRESGNIFNFTSPARVDRDNCHVFLPGWGFDGRILELSALPRPWFAPNRPLDPATTTAALDAFLDRTQIDSIVLTGWSMGAYLALDFARLYPERVKALYLLAMRRGWPAVEIEAIRSGLATDPRQFMKTFYRKCFLGYKPEYRQFTDSLEESYLTELDQDKLAAGLAYLQNFPLAARTAELAGLNLPTYLLHGGKDIIAPATEIAVIPGAASQIIKSAGHPIFLDAACPLDWHRKKETIRLKFSRAAATYDEHATVQREVAARLGALLPAKAPATILETGCGTGNYTALLHQRYPAARLTAIDFAGNMLAQARQKLTAEPTVSFQCADAELFLKESADTFDLVTSNATMHWFDNLAETSGLIAERLSAGGAMVCSIFGPATMQEMQTGLSAIHDQEVSLPSATFTTEEELQSIFAKLFAKVEISTWHLVRHYPTLTELLRNISKTGTAGWHPGQHLLNRRHLKELEQWFIKNYGHCRISYQIFMVQCRK